MSVKPSLPQDITRLQNSGARNFRLNQHQVDATGARVGKNRPDLQFDIPQPGGGVRRGYIEYEGPSAPRGLSHKKRILANDPDALVIIKRIK